MDKFVCKFLHVISALIFIISIFLAAALGGGRLLGFQSFVITSGSMIPQYPIGTVVYVREISPEQLQEGEDITFRISGESTATHRIREIDRENNQIYTYGINNRDEEGNPIYDALPVVYDHVIGRVEHALPMIGYPFILFGERGGKVFIIGLLLFSLLLEGITNHIENKKRSV